MTHTPTPWEAQDFCDGEEGFAIIGTNLGGLVAYASMQPADIDNQDTSRAEANAEFIVTAVNAYEANQAEIARLRDALSDLAEAARNACNAAQHPPLTDALFNADAALSPQP